MSIKSTRDNQQTKTEVEEIDNKSGRINVHVDFYVFCVSPKAMKTSSTSFFSL
eukprot:m.186454 g.186454  ORF g.186454 m.186454 type:complete len:53 (-) comp25589_c0_seq1:118-276(-)